MSNRRRRIAIAIAAVLALLGEQQSYAHWAVPVTNEVPVDRLLSNLENYEHKLPVQKKVARAHLEFLIGRLHSMAYARKTETANEVNIEKSLGEGKYFGDDKNEPVPWFEHVP
jgi:hypothetical protein